MFFFLNENTNSKSYENDSKGVFNFFQRHFVYFNPKADFRKSFQ